MIENPRSQACVRMTDPNSQQAEIQPATEEINQGPVTEQREGPRSLDDLIEQCLGSLGWTQMFQATLVSLAWFFEVQQSFISVFTDAQPKWRCNLPSCNENNPCRLPKDAWSWESPPSNSIVSQWSLECAGSIVTGLPASSFYWGSLIGGFLLAIFSDSGLGRKKMLILSTLIMSLSGALCAVSTNVWMCTAFKFVSGFGRSMVGTTALVLATEQVGKKRRGNIGIFGFIYIALGFLSLPLIAFLLRHSSWRLMYLCTCVPSLVYSLSLYFLAQESPRWLFIKGRKKEFAKTLQSLAPPANRSSLDPSFFDWCNQLEETPQEPGNFSSLKVLLRTGWSFRRLMAVMVVGFGIGITYYGMPLALGNLSVNLYLSVALNAFLELLSSLLTFFLIGKLRRKGTVLGLTLLSGICSVGCLLVRWKKIQIVQELVSFFGACTAFDVLLIYALELFPTCVRNSAASMARQSVAFGGAIGPLVVAAGRRKGLLAFGVFGATISVCGLFAACLPETRGRNLCDTMEEEESWVAELSGFCCF